MITVVCSEVATTEPNINLVYAVDVDHGEWSSTSLWTCTLVSRVMTKLYLVSEILQAILSEESTRPFL